MPTATPLWWRDRWCWAALLSVLVLVAHSVGAPLGEPVAEDFDFLSRALLSGKHTLLDGGGSQAFWRPVSHQLYYLTFGRLMLAAPWAMALIHALLMALAVWLVYRALRPSMTGPAAAVAASFPALAESTRTVLSWPSQFVDLGLWVFTAWALYETSRGRLWRAMLALALALGCKELAVVGALLLPWMPGERSLKQRTRWAIALGAVAAVWACVYLWVRHQAHLELPHHLERSSGLAPADVIARYQWAWLNSVRAIMSLPLVRTPYEWAIGWALGLLVGVALVMVWRQRRRRENADHWRWVAWGVAWFAIASATLVAIYPLWQPNRSGFGSLGLGISLAVLLELAHPLLLAMLVAIRIGAFAAAPAPVSTVAQQVPESGAFMDFTRLSRLQRLMEAVRLALKSAHPSLPHGAVIAEHYAPLMAEYAFGGSLALQCWYRDTTLRWVRFEDFERDTSLAPVTLVEFQPDREPIAALVDPRAMRLVDRASTEILHADWGGTLESLKQAEALPIDPGAGITRSMIETRRALAFIGQGRMMEAEYAARRAIIEWDANPNARYWLAVTIARQGRSAEAEAELDRAIARFPADSAAIQLARQLRRAR